jgi:hypothetical protein
MAARFKGITLIAGLSPVSLTSPSPSRKTPSRADEAGRVQVASGGHPWRDVASTAAEGESTAALGASLVRVSSFRAPCGLADAEAHPRPRQARETLPGSLPMPYSTVDVARQSRWLLHFLSDSAVMHNHDTNETFIPMTGTWRCSWENEKGEVEAVELGPLDVVSFPPGVARRFENVTPGDPSLEAILMFVIGGNGPKAEFTDASMHELEAAGVWPR